MSTGGAARVVAPGEGGGRRRALCVAVHVATATSAGHGGPAERAVFAAMAVACLPCVRALWRRPTRGVWRATAVMYGGMLFLHLLLLSAASGRSEHLAGAHHPASAGAGLGMWGGLLLAALQVAVAVAVLVSGRLPQVDPVGVRAG
ncbi:membrane protein of unknown function [Modestobacter italicus]|uniref:Uncharacterized protein n=1 Tax=Modestobacter italicus (strain DSM 44449 / CECT 9708 / BC 501) TaxID=2732864 RepID=I4EVX1_MODI5|nr:hypothetical protein [Modestobacter marinus]CCH87534.1 membrane protein of unknown function [Modestobacter marinus]